MHKKIYILVVLISLLAFSVAAKQDSDDEYAKKIHPHIKKFVGNDETVKLIVQFEGKPGKAESAVLEDESCEIEYMSRYMNLVAVECSGKTIAKLSKKGLIKYVWEDEVFESALDFSAQQINATVVWANGYNGSGVNISLIDTGINTSHPALQGKIILEKDFTADNNATDVCGHGTATASIIASINDTYKGISHGASLFNAKTALNSMCGHSSSAIISAIDWSIENGAQLIAMSIGSSISNCSLSVTANYVNQSVVDNNIPIIISAGNGGPSDSTIWTPGCAENAITVGAVDDSNTIASFSSRGPVIEDVTRVKPDLVAPGVDINSADHNSPGVSPRDGTSFSAPHVSGVVALMLQAQPGLRYDQIKEILKNTSIDLGYDENTQGEGLVNASAAVDLALNTTPLPPPAPDHPGLMVYYTSAAPANASKFRDILSDNTFSAEKIGLELGVSADLVWVDSAVSPTIDEELVVTQDDGNQITVQVHTREGFSNKKVLVANAGGSSQRRFDVAYEQSNGRAIVVFGNNTAKPSYEIWNGSAYVETGVLATAFNCGGTATWIELASKPAANEVAAVYQDANGNYCAQIWNGSAWGNVKHFGNDSGTNTQKFDVEYEQSGQALVTFESSTPGRVSYCTWTGSWCSSPTQLSDRGGQNDWVRLGADRTSDRMLLGVLQIGDNDVDVIEWNGTGFGTWKQTDGTVEAGGDRTLDVAYVGESGQGMIVYVDSNADVPSYALCTNAANCFAGTWSAVTTTTSTSNNCGEAADLDYLGLVPDPLSDKVLLYGLSQTTHYKCAQIYDGTGWLSWNSNLGSGSVSLHGEGATAAFEKV